MNMPNRKSVKTTSLPLNFHLEKTYPLMDPRTVDKMVAKTVSTMELTKLGFSNAAASKKLDPLSETGGCHDLGRLMFSGIFRAVTTII